MYMCRRYLTALLLLLAALPWCGGAEPLKLEVEAEPAEFPAGGWTQVAIRVNREVDRRDIKLPKHPRAKWHPERSGVSRNYSIVNGKSSRSMTYTLPLSSDTPGVLTLPPVELRLADGTTAKSRRLTLRVLAAGEAPRGAGTPAGRIVVPEGRQGFYAGEEIPVDFELTIPPGLKVRELDFPRMNCDGPVILPDLSGRRTRHPHFLDPARQERDTAEGTAQLFTFRTMLRFMRPGEFELGATETLLAAEPRSRRQPRSRPRFGFGFDDDMDDFFSDPFGAGARRMVVKYPGRKFKILPVPPPPAGSHVLELFGDWRVVPMLSASSARVGDVLELEVRLDGTGSLAGFRPPKLEFPGFRVYPPELKSEPDGRHSIRYALVPLRPGEFELAPEFSLLDMATGRYRTVKAQLSLAVTGSPLADNAAPTPAPRRSAALPTTAAVPKAAPPAVVPPAAVPDVLHRVEAPREPLWRRGVRRGTLIAGVLAAAALFLEIALRRRERRNSPDPAEERRHREVATLIKRLKAGDDVLEILHSGGTEALARTLKLPPGSSAAEIAPHVADPSLRELLAGSDRDAFAPAEQRRHCELAPAGRRELLKLLKRALAVGLLFAVTFALPAAEPGEVRLAAERAVLLAPRDSAARSALAAVANSAGETPAASPAWVRWRDRFRPDEYLTLAGALLGMACFTLAALRRRRRRTAFVISWLFAALTVLALAAAWSQYGPAGGYRGSRAVVTAAKLPLYALPVASGGREVGSLSGGSVAEVLEVEGGFLRLRGSGIEGWCRAGGAERILPAER